MYVIDYTKDSVNYQIDKLDINIIMIMEWKLLEIRKFIKRTTINLLRCIDKILNFLN